MEIIIKGNAKEIAVLALELQERHNKAKKRAVNIESPSQTIDNAFKLALSNTTRDMPAK